MAEGLQGFLALTDWTDRLPWRGKPRVEQCFHTPHGPPPRFSPVGEATRMNTARRWFLALDQGTSSSRACLVDTQGQIKATASRPLPVSYPQPGWVEQDPEE